MSSVELCADKQLRYFIFILLVRCYTNTINIYKAHTQVSIANIHALLRTKSNYDPSDPFTRVVKQDDNYRAI